MTDMTIGRLAKRAGVGVETIRFYERRGLVEQPRKPAGSGFRTYSNDVVLQVRFIRRAQQIGFSLAEIEELLSLRTDPDGDCTEVRERASDKLAGVDAKIAELKRMRKALQTMIDACPAQGARRFCTILDALESKPGTACKAAPSRRTGRERKWS